MIPFIVPPLTGLSVLVTRPRPQATHLCEQIATAGGEAIAFPALEIEALAAASVSGRYDLTIFTSSNAANHGIASLTRDNLGQIAAIGTATAKALAARDLSVHITPETPAGSEMLLAHPKIRALDGARVLIVRGEGGRELLRESLQAQGCVVEVVEVYRRVRARPSSGEIAALEQRWSDEGIGIVTATSGDTLQHLHELLTDAGRSHLRHTPLLAVSERVQEIARGLGLVGECIVARSAEDVALLGTLSNWRTRARAAAER